MLGVKKKMQRNYSLLVLSLLLFSACVSTPVTDNNPSSTVSTRSITSAKLHAILVADTKDLNIGSDIDLGNMKELLITIQQHTGLTLEQYSIAGNAFTSDNVNNTLTQLSVQPEDMVIFYYSGHGSNLGNSRWPSLKLSDQFLDFDQVTQTLENKNPRLLISIADACNNFIDESSNTPTRQVIKTTPKADNYRQLFLNYRGKIKASAAKHGQFAAGSSSEGGKYTNAFLNSLNKELASADKPSWHTVMKRAESPIRFRDKQGIERLQMPQSKVQVADGGVPPDQSGSGQPNDPLPTSDQLLLQLLPADTFKIGENMIVKVTNSSPKAGYLFVWDIDSSGKLARLLPNEINQKHRLDARKTRQIPEHIYVGYSLTMKEPTGNGFIVALLVDESAKQQLLSENLSNLSTNQAQTTLQQLRGRLTQLEGAIITAVQYQIVR